MTPADDAASGVVFFPTPSGAEWAHVRIHFTDAHTVSATVGGVSRSLHYSQMGMHNSKSGRPTKQWELLYAFAKGDGRMDWDSPDADRKNQKRREVLAQNLRDFFRIEGDPFEVEGNGWRAQFRLSL